MDKSERNQPSRSLTAPTLRKLCSEIIRNPLLRMAPGGRELTEMLGVLRLWVGETEQRLQALECAQGELAAQANPSLQAKFRAQLYGLLSTAEREGQLDQPIADGSRPGGPMAGDIVGGPRPLRAPVNFDPGESYGGSD